MGCSFTKCLFPSYSMDSVVSVEMDECKKGTNIDIYSGKNCFKLYVEKNNTIINKISIPKLWIEGKHCTIQTSNDVEINVEGTKLKLPGDVETKCAVNSANVPEDGQNVDIIGASNNDTVDSAIDCSSNTDLIPILTEIDIKHKQNMIREIKFIQIIPDLMKTCQISHHVSPSEFYVNLSDNISCKMFIEDEAMSSISGPLRLSPSCDPLSQCLLVSGEFEGARGVIANVEAEKITFKLLDIGVELLVEENMLAGIPDKIDFSHIPAQAIRCSLKKCKNNAEVIESLKYITLNKTTSKIHFISCKDNTWDVSLLRTSDILLKENEPIHMALGYATQPKLESSQVYIGYTDDTNKQIWLQKEEESSVYDELNNICEAKGGETQPLHSFNIGDPCLCKSVEDDSWYRAVICSFDGAGKVCVQYVDYGNKENLPCKNVKSLLKEDVMKHHPLCYPCIFKDSEKISDFTKIQDLLNITMEVIIHQKVGPFFEVSLFHGEMDIIDKLSPESGYLVQEYIPKIEEQISLFVSHVEDDGRIWVQDTLKSEALDQVMECISTSEKSEVQPVLGLFCCCQYSADDSWYRAVITSVEGDQFLVRYIDYGNSEESTADKLKPLDLEFTSLPSQAIQCCLFDENKNELLKSPLLSTVDILSSDAEFTGKLVQHEEHGLVLRDSKTAEGGNLCDTIRQVLPEELISSDDPIPTLPLQNNVEIPLIVSEYESSGVFWVQSLEKEDEFIDLTNKIATRVADVSTHQLVSNVTAGIFCMAKYDVDELYYRAIVTDVEGDSCNVKFVDYGNGSSVKLAELIILFDDMKSLPMQAVKCEFKVLEGKNLSEEAEQLIRELTDSESTLTGKLEEIDGRVLLHSLLIDGNLFDEMLVTPENNNSNGDTHIPNGSTLGTEPTLDNSSHSSQPVADDTTNTNEIIADDTTNTNEPVTDYTSELISDDTKYNTETIPDVSTRNGVSMRNCANIPEVSIQNGGITDVSTHNGESIQEFEVGTWQNDQYVPVDAIESEIISNSETVLLQDFESPLNSKSECGDSDVTKENNFYSVVNSENSSDEIQWTDVPEKAPAADTEWQ